LHARDPCFDKPDGAAATEGTKGPVFALERKSFALSQSVLRAEPESAVSDSLFPPEEGPSFCSRPTPVTAVPESLRRFTVDGTPPDESGIVPRSSPRPDSMRPSSDSFEQVFFQGPKPSLAPSLVPPVVRRPVSRARTAVSLLLFVTLFGGVASLLGLALLQKFAIEPGALVASLKAFAASVL
jgi:hypothetical protein